MSRWQQGQLARCHCEASPVGQEPVEVLRGAAPPTLIRDGVEHICPTAERVLRARGPKPKGLSGAKMSITVPQGLLDRCIEAAGGPGNVSAWARPLLEAACAAAEAAAAQKPRS